MSQFTKAEISALKGSELEYQFSSANGNNVDGKAAYAFVAQADINKGITIRGQVPKGTESSFGLKEGEEAVLSCCNLTGNDTEGKEEVLARYVEAIRLGVFDASIVNGGRPGSGGASYMAGRCVF